MEGPCPPDGTRSHRQSLLDNLGRLADAPLGKVKKGDVNEWFQFLAARPWADGKPLADSTRAATHKDLTALFRSAVTEELILRSPVGPRPKAERHDEPFIENELITPLQLAKLVIAARDGVKGARPMQMFARAVVVAATSGLRPGEFAGLKVRNVDCRRLEIHVVEQATRAAGGTQRTKSAASRRTVPVPKETIDAIAEQLSVQLRGANEIVFCSSRGSALTQVRFGEYFRRYREAAGIGGRTMHDLQHLYVSALIRARRSTKVVQKRLGHASVSVTLDVYTQLWLDDDDADRVAIAEQLRDMCGLSTLPEPKRGVRDRRGGDEMRKTPCLSRGFSFGVSDGTRTRDSQDHNLVLYQLNYTHHARRNLHM